MSGEGGKRLGGRKWLLVPLVEVGVEVWFATGDKDAALSGSFLSKASMLAKLDFFSFMGEGEERAGLGEAMGLLFSRDTV